MERLFATFLFIIILPILVFISMLIAVFDRTFPFFTQIRVGKDEKLFLIFKFKTMMANSYSDNISHGDYDKVYQQQISRVTKIGSFLRKTSLDELPQLINIINGSMSFVGPRPLLSEQLNAIPKLYRIRNNALPGITGLAQVKGRRRLSWLSQLKYDKFYVLNKSVLFDFFILIYTLKTVFFADGIEPSKGKNWREYL